MRDSNSPMRLWCYCCERRAAIMTLTANNLYQLQGQNPHMATLNKMGDISNLCQFNWYEWVYFRHHTAAFPYQKEVLERCLGPTKDEGNKMTQWILQENGLVVLRRTLRRLRQEEISPYNLIEKAKRDAFDSDIKGSWETLLLRWTSQYCSCWTQPRTVTSTLMTFSVQTRSSLRPMRSTRRGDQSTSSRWQIS